MNIHRTIRKSPHTSDYQKLGVILALFAFLHRFNIINFDGTNRRGLNFCILVTAYNYNSNKILMIYNFHWTNYSSFSFLSSHYLPYFKKYFKFQVDVVFYGPVEDTNRGIRCNGLKTGGFFSYYSFIKAINDTKKKYYGYLFLNDDSFVNPFILNFMNLDEMILETVDFTKSWIWNKEYRKENNNFLNEICSSNKYSSINCSNKENIKRHGWSDFFYVPFKHVKEVKSIFEVAFKHNLYLEFVITQTFQFFNFSCAGHCTFFEMHTNINSTIIEKEFEYKMFCCHIHPLKYSSKQVRKNMHKFFSSNEIFFKKTKDIRKYGYSLNNNSRCYIPYITKKHF